MCGDKFVTVCLKKNTTNSTTIYVGVYTHKALPGTRPKAAQAREARHSFLSPTSLFKSILNVTPLLPNIDTTIRICLFQIILCHMVTYIYTHRNFYVYVHYNYLLCFFCTLY